MCVCAQVQGRGRMFSEEQVGIRGGYVGDTWGYGGMRGGHVEDTWGYVGIRGDT